MDAKDMVEGYAISRVWYAFETQGKIQLLMNLISEIQLMKDNSQITENDLKPINKIILALIERIREAPSLDLPPDECKNGYSEMVNQTNAAIKSISHNNYNEAWRKLFEIREFAIPIWNDIYYHSQLRRI